MSEGLIFDIKRYSINDGPGIRTTVFFKGCPLQCRWCHNPEGQSSTPEVMVRAARCLKDCSECLAVCPEGALSKSGAIPVLDRIRCTTCGKCAEMCPTQAIEMVGRRLNATDLVWEIEKDRVFHEESGGGVTFSGGEPLSQPDFLDEVLELCRKKEIHAAVDTCGLAAPEVLDRIAAKADLFLFDLKTMDEQKHIAFTGESNRLILENLKRLAATGKKIVVRIPIVPSINDDTENIRRTAGFLRTLEGISEISLLPYHRLGRDKSKGIEKESSCLEFSSPTEESLERLKADLESRGFRVSRGE
ncbi:MAG TPA: glycyl-radical enzyme activating protein [Candidatus Desulfaltia sp.]|nr:glycyl-radical enzyme activating protein [Candidatus Desulfaltia sp.]